MKLWMLLDKKTDRGSLDVMSGCVVRAVSPKSARKLAAARAMDEGRDVWLDAKLSTCHQLNPNGTAQVLMVDRYAK